MIMDPITESLVLDRGIPLAMATVLYSVIKLLRTSLAQTVLAMVSPKLVWANWPKPLCMGVVFAGAALAAISTAMLAGTPLVASLPLGITAGLGAMGLDAGIGSVRAPAATAASIAIPIPDPK